MFIKFFLDTSYPTDNASIKNKCEISMKINEMYILEADHSIQAVIIWSKGFTFRAVQRTLRIRLQNQ